MLHQRIRVHVNPVGISPPMGEVGGGRRWRLPTFLLFLALILTPLAFFLRPQPPSFEPALAQARYAAEYNLTLSLYISDLALSQARTSAAEKDAALAREEAIQAKEVATLALKAAALEKEARAQAEGTAALEKEARVQAEGAAALEKEARVQAEGAAALEKDGRVQAEGARVQAEEVAARALALAESPANAANVSKVSYDAAEKWRLEMANIVYANMTDEEFDTAVRWKGYAHPDDPVRTCAVALPVTLVEDIVKLSALLAGVKASLNNQSRSIYLGLHAFHTTGLEGNTLTLPESLLTVQGYSLRGGYHPRVMISPAMTLSATEVMNVAQLWDALGLSMIPGSSAVPVLDPVSLTLASLVDMNSAITRGTKHSTPGLRRYAVAIGSKHVILPMPDEVPVLVDEYLAWLSRGVGEVLVLGGEGGGEEMRVEHALALACNAHTRLVFVHPFGDGNGRLARTLSALVLQRVGLPAPMFHRQARSEYMEAVSQATLHAQAVRRSLATLLALARSQDTVGKGGGEEDALLAAYSALEL